MTPFAVQFTFKNECSYSCGLNPEASQNEVNKAYQNLMKLVHPDIRRLRVF
ncbi:J domain-containing protein [Wolbachia pipientis]|uniref:J domain-containing protein n=2 Tax=Wolbachia TaxID=953 RepID=UPI0021756AD1|nr:J domain-containing protein [Wolbachia pipientis]